VSLLDTRKDGAGGKFGDCELSGFCANSHDITIPLVMHVY
jgi:hypothetical protein